MAPDDGAIIASMMEMQFLFWKIFLSGLLFLSAATNILKKPQNKSHLATLVVWQHLSYTNSCEMLKLVHYYNNHTSWVQSCDWWAGRQLAVGAKAGYHRPLDGQVDGGVVKQDAGAIIRLAVGSWWRCWRWRASFIKHFSPYKCQPYIN